MVNEATANIPHFLDFDSVCVKAKNSNSDCQKNILQRSSSGLVPDKKEKQLQTQQDSIAEVFDALLPKSAENLSWNFFEQVSTLDNQLRNDEASASYVNGCQLMTSPRNSTSHDRIVVNGHIGQETATESLSKSNGFMPGATKKLSSQHSPDLVQHQTHQQQTRHATFQFTSPTATFKRKKQQQQQQQQHQQQHQQINNNYNCNDKNQLLATPTPCKSGGGNCIANQTFTLHPPVTPHKQLNQHQQQQQQQRPFGHNDNDDDFNEVAATAMISESGVIINSDTTTTGTGISTGTGTTHSLKTRTLPAVSVVRATAYTADTAPTADTDNDHHHQHQHPLHAVNDGTSKRYHPSQSESSHKQQRGARRHSRRKQQRMGATLQHSADSFVDGIEQHFSLIGWRKKCLYTLLALLLVLVIINLVLTLWILKVMEFSGDGMGLLKIVPGGIQLTGQAVIMDMLRASTIRSKHGQPIAIESSRNFSINTRDTNGMLENHLFLGHDKLECLATGFRINDTTGRNLFSVNRNEVTIGAHALRIDGEGGTIFRESIQTPHVRAEPGRELRLESPTRQLEIAAARDINLQSRAGGIELSAQDQIKLSTLDGSLRFESTKILMPHLRTVQTPTTGASQNHEHLHRVYQLCACANGKLFITAPHSICAGDDSTVCR